MYVHTSATCCINCGSSSSMAEFSAVACNMSDLVLFRTFYVFFERLTMKFMRWLGKLEAFFVAEAVIAFIGGVIYCYSVASELPAILTCSR